MPSFPYAPPIHKNKNYVTLGYLREPRVLETYSITYLL